MTAGGPAQTTDATFVARFVGEEERLQFTAVNPGRTIWGGLYDTTLRLVEVNSQGEGTSRDLLLAQTLFRPDQSEARPRYERVLLKDVASMRIRYFGAALPGEAAAWHNEWRNRRQLPALVAVAVGLRAGDPRHWPELVVELKLR